MRLAILLRRIREAVMEAFAHKAEEWRFSIGVRLEAFRMEGEVPVVERRDEAELVPYPFADAGTDSGTLIPLILRQRPHADGTKGYTVLCSADR